METMTAYQLVGWRQPAEFREVPVPRPGHGEVRIRVGAVGLCHTDILFLESPAGAFPYPLPMTLGHENAGWVEELGAGVEGFAPGDAVLADGHQICGRCEFCRIGADNYCVRGRHRGQGAGVDGGLAPYLVVPQNRLVPLGDLDPRAAAPLADAGRTSYHAVRRALPRLRPGSTALVIGAGGLGGYAIQWLRALTEARIVVADVAPHRLALAREFGADETIVSDSATTTVVRELTDGRGAEAVFDFVGNDATMRTALDCARTMGTAALVGAGGGTVAVGWGCVPLECDVYVPLGGNHAELHDVVTLARAGKVRNLVEVFAFDQTPEAYERVRVGDIKGRAVVTPSYAPR
ncbi:MAG TPA: NAD(P)-dependent alcohol dehydrogenase [Acidimicrobiales bacterium]|jgi:propanol-preferring alcohol dehydrogenase|nr:NAD(P)-dependent alcohol dehydrogenase [Acidimicrobiales bacterium]